MLIRPFTPYALDTGVCFDDTFLVSIFIFCTHTHTALSHDQTQLGEGIISAIGRRKLGHAARFGGLNVGRAGGAETWPHLGTSSS